MLRFLELRANIFIITGRSYGSLAHPGMTVLDRNSKPDVSPLPTLRIYDTNGATSPIKFFSYCAIPQSTSRPTSLQTNVTIETTSLITAQRPQDELHAPPKLVRRRIAAPAKPSKFRKVGKPDSKLALSRVGYLEYFDPHSPFLIRRGGKSRLSCWNPFARLYR